MFFFCFLSFFINSFWYCLGVMPVIFLKYLQKYAELSNPVKLASCIVETLFRSSVSLAHKILRSRMYCCIDLPVAFLNLRSSVLIFTFKIPAIIFPLIFPAKLSSLPYKISNHSPYCNLLYRTVISLFCIFVCQWNTFVLTRKILSYYSHPCNCFF